VSRAFAALGRSIRFAPSALTALALAAAPYHARAEEPRAAAEPVDVLVTAPAASSRAPAAQATVIQADQFAGEVRSVAEMLAARAGRSGAGDHAFPAGSDR